MSTFLSGAAAYCTAARFRDAYDARTVGDLLSDSGTRLTAAEIDASDALATLLMEASGWVESACVPGEMYSPTDLASLTGNSASMLQGLVAGIAMFFLWDRRPQRLADMPVPTRCKLALEMCEQLRRGQRVFGVVENMQAGLIKTDQVDESQIQALGLATTLAQRYWGTRGKEERLNTPH